MAGARQGYARWLQAQLVLAVGEQVRHPGFSLDALLGSGIAVHDHGHEEQHQVDDRYAEHSAGPANARAGAHARGAEPEEDQPEDGGAEEVDGARGADRDELRVIWDQLGTPTYAIDLAGCILSIIESGSQHYGLYHYSNEGVTSWYDFAVAIFELSNLPVRTIPIRTAEYPTKATRPPYSVMDKTKAKTHLGVAIPHWRESLNVCISRLAELG